jgi:hypothetical protein
MSSPKALYSRAAGEVWEFSDLLVSDPGAMPARLATNFGRPLNYELPANLSLRCARSEYVDFTPIPSPRQVDMLKPSPQ